MQHNQDIIKIAKKEISVFFSSPIAYLFLCTFVSITLFIFFWGETFFARNISDVRPMFEWMPILLIFLCSALTMKMWSDEHRSGTTEFIITLPVNIAKFVAGKFVACLFLLALALCLTLPLPITISFIADLDWGPVISAYIATVLLGCAYVSIGLFVSSKNDNQIVSLIITSLICGIFYLLGSSLLTNFFGNTGADLLRSLGTGSRFSSISKGIIDIRDLYYYLSIVAVFLTLNVYAIERQRWDSKANTAQHKKWHILIGLLVVNSLFANIWLSSLNGLRLDMTRGKIYSISSHTINYLNRLNEPLLIRGYFSSKTHPLLAPLVPQLKDLISEYQVAGKGRINVEFIDPMQNSELEAEANSKYGIKPLPFQVQDKYQSSLVNSYFDILVQYGDEYRVLGFRDLIDIKAQNEGDIDVQLRNPEFDLTSSIKKVVQNYQSAGNLYESLPKNITFTGYVSDEKYLPKSLTELKKDLTSVLTEIRSQSQNKVNFEFVRPEDNNGQVASEIADKYGFKPMATSLFSTKTFYYYMIMSDGNKIIQIDLPSSFDKENLKRNIEEGLKRFASGMTKTVALVTPMSPVYGQPYNFRNIKSFNTLKSGLETSVNVIKTDLKDGAVPAEADMLFVVSPENFDEKQVFAVDQFLMKGGTVILSTSPYTVDIARGSLNARSVVSGLEDWLQNNGLSIEKQFVLDKQNAVFPVPVSRNLGGLRVQEMHMVDYPYFVDLRSDGLSQDNPITSTIPQLTMSWSSPITLSANDNKDRKSTNLITSSNKSWLSSSTDVVPQINSRGGSVYDVKGEQKQHTLAVMVQGRFDSFFKDKQSPLLNKEEDSKKKDAERDISVEPNVSGIISKSPESSRIILFASNEFLSDQVMQILGAVSGSQYNNPIQFAINAVEWSLEEEQGLLNIRARDYFSKTLPPLSRDSQMFIEYLNYALAFGLIALIAIARRYYKARTLERSKIELGMSGA